MHRAHDNQKTIKKRGHNSLCAYNLIITKNHNLLLTYCIYTNNYSLTTNLSGGGFYYAITSLSLEEILGKVI